MDNIAGVILAGGQSTRMGAGDKCLMSVGGIPLIDRVNSKLSKDLKRILINSNAEPHGFSHLDQDIKADVFEGFAGPLAGVLTGMRWAEDIDGTKWIVTAAADTPFFPDDYVNRMSKAKQGNRIVLAASNGRKHPVFGIWDISLADDLETFLKNGDRKVMLFVQKYAHKIEPFDTTGSDPFFNVNTPEDRETAEKIIMGIDHDGT